MKPGRESQCFICLPCHMWRPSPRFFKTQLLIHCMSNFLHFWVLNSPQSMIEGNWHIVDNIEGWKPPISSARCQEMSLMLKLSTELDVTGLEEIMTGVTLSIVSWTPYSTWWFYLDLSMTDSVITSSKFGTKLEAVFVPPRIIGWVLPILCSPGTEQLEES